MKGAVYVTWSWLLRPLQRARTSRWHVRCFGYDQEPNHEEQSGGKDGEAMKAARELATRYNRDMIEFASLQLQRTRPALAEANAAALRACKTWNAYSALVESLIKAEAKKPKRPVTEAAPAPGTKPAPRAKPALTEAVANHPSLRMATRHRSVTA